jgi:hypothetical protein
LHGRRCLAPCHLQRFCVVAVIMKSSSREASSRLFRLRLLGLLILSGLILGLGACAESVPPQETPDGFDDTPDIGIGADTPLNPPSDTGSPSQPDVVTPPQPVCTAGQSRCASETLRETCRSDGSGYEQAPCEAGTQCQDGQCQIVQACSPNTRYCHDSDNLLICRSNGSGYTTQPCGAGNVCIGDACFSGKPNGESCSTHDECAGQLCHCGSEENCPAAYTRAYCTHTCGTTECTGSEWCLDASYLTGEQHYDHCVRRCDAACALSGLGCQYIPVKGVDGLRWEQGCVHRQLVGVGAECTSDAQCLGGTCLRDYFGFGYCTRRCETGGCPTGSACVQLRDSEYWCSALCGDGVSLQGECPLKVTRPTDFSITCKLQSMHGSDQVTRVCSRT